MTSNIQDGFEVISSSERSQDIKDAKFQAFNDNPVCGCGWCSDDPPPHFIGIKLPSPKVANCVTFTSPRYLPYSPKEFQMEGSNDGKTFMTLSIQSTSFDGNIQKRSFRFNNTQPFNCYRIFVTKNHCDYDGYLHMNVVACKHVNFGFSE